MSGCKTCGDTINDEGEILPSGANTPDAVPATAPNTVTTCTTKQTSKICSTIKDECHDCAEAPNPFARIQLKNAFALPACDQEVEAIFVEDISNMMVGLTVYAVDSAQKTIRLKITKITPKNKLTLKNVCSSCCGSTKPVGETVSADTYFSWGLPDCCATATSTDSDNCLIGTFFFPAPGATAAAQVQNSYAFLVGGLYSMGGFIWKVSARVTSTQILLENPVPGNGSVAGGFIEGGCDGSCIYPITPISEASECDDSAVTAVTLIGCTASGKKKLTSDKACGYVRFDKDAGSFSAVDLLGGSTVTGPHYIQWDKDNPCNSKLVSAPSLVGTLCSTISCSLFLTPANTTQEYELEVATSTPFTSTAPNNVVTLGSREFTVIAVVTAGTPGKIRLKPRFAVNASETIAEGSQICVVSGCQPFPSTDYTAPCDLETFGQKVYCAEDGLRTNPRATSSIGAFGFNQETNIGGIELVGTQDRDVLTFNLVNPSTCYDATVFARLDYTNRLTLDEDGVWFCETYWDTDAVPVTLRDSFRIASQNGQQIIDVKMSTIIAIGLAPGQTKVLNFKSSLRTANSSANTNLVWTSANGLATWQIVTI